MHQGMQVTWPLRAQPIRETVAQVKALVSPRSWQRWAWVLQKLWERVEAQDAAA